MRRLGGGGGVGFHPKSEDKGHGKRHKVNKQTIKRWGEEEVVVVGNWKAGGEEGREKCIGIQHAAEARQLFAGYVVVGVARMLGGETGRGEEVGSLTSNHGRLGVATQVLAQQPCEGRVTVRDKLLLVLLSLALAGVCRHQGMVMRVYICVHACVYVFVRACVCVAWMRPKENDKAWKTKAESNKPDSSASAEMTLPRVVKERLMFAPSLSRLPDAPVESARSDPAKSTRLILLCFSAVTSEFGTCWYLGHRGNAKCQ